MAIQWWAGDVLLCSLVSTTLNVGMIVGMRVEEVELVVVPTLVEHDFIKYTNLTYFELLLSKKSLCKKRRCPRNYFSIHLVRTESYTYTDLIWLENLVVVKI